MKPVPVKWAKEIAGRIGADGVAVFCFDGEGGAVAATTYGADKARCDQMGRWAGHVVDALRDGWIDAPFANTTAAEETGEPN